MTIMRVSIAGTKLEPETKASLVKRLIEAFATVEVGRFSEAIAAGFTVQLEELETQDLWMGLKPAGKTHQSAKAAVIDARVMAGPWNAAMKEELFASLNKIMRDVLKISENDPSTNIWITIVEIPKDSFCVDGKVVSISQLSPVFTSDRQQRISEYLRQN